MLKIIWISLSKIITNKFNHIKYIYIFDFNLVSIWMKSDQIFSNFKLNSFLLLNTLKLFKCIPKIYPPFLIFLILHNKIQFLIIRMRHINKLCFRINNTIFNLIRNNINPRPNNNIFNINNPLLTH